MDSQDQSAYWFLKGEMQSRAPLNQMDLEKSDFAMDSIPDAEANSVLPIQMFEAINLLISSNPKIKKKYHKKEACLQ